MSPLARTQLWGSPPTADIGLQTERGRGRCQLEVESGPGFQAATQLLWCVTSPAVDSPPGPATENTQRIKERMAEHPAERSALSLSAAIIRRRPTPRSWGWRQRRCRSVRCPTGSACGFTGVTFQQRRLHPEGKGVGRRFAADGPPCLPSRTEVDGRQRSCGDLQRLGGLG